MKSLSSLGFVVHCVLWVLLSSGVMIQRASGAICVFCDEKSTIDSQKCSKLPTPLTFRNIVQCDDKEGLDFAGCYGKGQRGEPDEKRGCGGCSHGDRTKDGASCCLCNLCNKANPEGRITGCTPGGGYKPPVIDTVCHSDEDTKGGNVWCLPDAKDCLISWTEADQKDPTLMKPVGCGTRKECAAIRDVKRACYFCDESLCTIPRDPQTGQRVGPLKCLEGTCSADGDGCTKTDKLCDLKNVCLMKTKGDKVEFSCGLKTDCPAESKDCTYCQDKDYCTKGRQVTKEEAAAKPPTTTKKPSGAGRHPPPSSALIFFILLGVRLRLLSAGI